jgi:hypothetical protein
MRSLAGRGCPVAGLTRASARAGVAAMRSRLQGRASMVGVLVVGVAAVFAAVIVVVGSA